VSKAEDPKLWGALLRGGGAVGPLVGAQVVCIRDIFTLNEIRTQGKICILISTLLG
jgi:hypothetical protein